MSESLNHCVSYYEPDEIPWVIQCDFDGTISRQDVTDTLLTRFGQRGWERYEYAWERGLIGSRECMVEQIKLLDMSLEELSACLDTIEIDPGFKRFAQDAREAGIPITIVSDGLDYAIQHILAREGLADLTIIANHLVQTGPRSWQLETPWANPVCPSANCKCQTMKAAHQKHQAVLYIGDGSSDFCVSNRANLVLAKGKLSDFCHKQNIHYRHFDDFSQAIAVLEGVVSGDILGVRA